MAVPTDAYETYDAAGEREDISDMIYNVSPTDTPGLSGYPTTEATNFAHQWQTDSLAAAATNVEPEGDDAADTAAVATTLLSNTCQISDKVPRVTGTLQAVLKAGRRDEMAYQVAKMAKELKRDMEFDIHANNTIVTGASGTARELGGLPAWITTNTSNGTSGSDGSAGTARTDGTQRAFTETLLKAVLVAQWTAGGDPDTIFVGGFNKQKFSTFTGNATRFKGAEDYRLIAGIDIYDSDFGQLEIIPNRFSRARDCLVLEREMIAVAYLRPFRLWDLAKVGDTERKQLLTEYTIEVRNEAALGAVWDLNTA